MRVFILPQDPPLGQFVDITGEDHHYLARVRRMKVGDTFPGRDRRGGRWVCTVVDIDPSSLRLRLEEDPAAAMPGQPSINLIQCLPKAAKMDLIVRQAAEAGVQRVIPATSRFSQVRLGAGEEKKVARWRRIARQAVQQSGAPHQPDIDGPMDLGSILQSFGAIRRHEVRLFFHPDREGSEPLHRYLSKNPKIITLVVGPEGGLSSDEVRLLRKRGFAPVTVGRTVLRAETAALYAVAAVQIVIDERDAWEPK
jgi:16S rRNA (uracil1498-N3)-methyltransferase